MVLSRAYQMPSMTSTEGQKEYVFAGPSVKRMSAEQFADAVSILSGASLAEKPAATLSDAMLLYKNARWIWSDAKASTAAAPGVVYFRRLVTVNARLETARTLVTADNRFTLLVNGKEVTASDDWMSPTLIDLKPHLREGENTICAVVENTMAEPSPAGFFFFLELLHTPSGAVKRRAVVQSDKSWRWSDQAPPAGWTQVSFNGKWKPVVELGGLNAEPWQLAGKLPGNAHVPDQIRASLCNADPLTVALGRPNREQVNTSRPADATTLQALELTNGVTLASLLGHGGAALAKQKGSTDDLIVTIYAKALGRAPTATELSIAREVVGGEKKAAGVEDLLWVVVMLPEFQLIR
jgi:hypothetical protein